MRLKCLVEVCSRRRSGMVMSPAGHNFRSHCAVAQGQMVGKADMIVVVAPRAATDSSCWQTCLKKWSCSADCTIP